MSGSKYNLLDKSLRKGLLDLTCNQRKTVFRGKFVMLRSKIRDWIPECILSTTFCATES